MNNKNKTSINYFANKIPFLTRHNAEKALLTLIVIGVPGYYLFEMTVVLDRIVKVHDPGNAKLVANAILSTFLFINVAGNIFMTVTTDTRVRKDTEVEEKTKYCEVCELWQPPKSFHCGICDVCILRRDHHCAIFACCIGLFNYRYFILALSYIVVSLMYCFYWNFYFLASQFDSLLHAVRPVLHAMCPFFKSELRITFKEFCIMYFVASMVLLFLFTIYFLKHSQNAVKGVTSYEHDRLFKSGDKDVIANFKKAFGVRWYCAVIWPFASSPIIEM